MGLAGSLRHRGFSSSHAEVTIPPIPINQAGAVNSRGTRPAGGATCLRPPIPTRAKPSPAGDLTFNETSPSAWHGRTPRNLTEKGPRTRHRADRKGPAHVRRTQPARATRRNDPPVDGYSIITLKHRDRLRAETETQNESLDRSPSSTASHSESTRARVQPRHAAVLRQDVMPAPRSKPLPFLEGHDIKINVHARIRKSSTQSVSALAIVPSMPTATHRPSPYAAS